MVSHRLDTKGNDYDYLQIRNNLARGPRLLRLERPTRNDAALHAMQGTLCGAGLDTDRTARLDE